MIREDTVAGVGGAALRHVTSRAVEAATAFSRFVAGQTFGAKPGSAFRCSRYSMWVVTGAAPKSIPRGALADTFGQFFNVAVYLKALRAHGHEKGDIIRKNVARGNLRFGGRVVQRGTCRSDGTVRRRRHGAAPRGWRG